MEVTQTNINVIAQYQCAIGEVWAQVKMHTDVYQSYALTNWAIIAVLAMMRSSDIERVQWKRKVTEAQ